MQKRRDDFKRRRNVKNVKVKENKMCVYAVAYYVSEKLNNVLRLIQLQPIKGVLDWQYTYDNNDEYGRIKLKGQQKMTNRLRYLNKYSLLFTPELGDLD